MNNTLIISGFTTIIVGFLATIGTVLGAWLANNAKFKEIEGSLNSKSKELEGTFNSKIKEIEGVLKVIVTKLEHIDARLTRVENKLDELELRVRNLELFNASNTKLISQ